MTSDFKFAQDTVGYIIEGVLDVPTVRDVKRQIVERIKKEGTIQLYVEDCGLERLTFFALCIACLIPIQHARRIHKIALVTDRKWIHRLCTVVSYVSGVEIKNFDSVGRMNAMDWIARG
ncbi:MAG: STAS/SEC14 domain-containing protein [Flavobacteriaceae bacterium]|nr:STAS/SEC14 domain-containing protein [Flavobacteriaceae bacterium]